MAMNGVAMNGAMNGVTAPRPMDSKHATALAMNGTTAPRSTAMNGATAMRSIHI
jgi:hypothetical protein